jgi:hypothetical protein
MDAFNQGGRVADAGRALGERRGVRIPGLANAGEYRGHDGFVSWITSWTDAWEEVTAEVTDNVPVGARHVVTSVHQEGRGRGIEVSIELAFLFDVSDEGLCSYLAMLPTSEEAFQMAEQRELS